MTGGRSRNCPRCRPFGAPNVHPRFRTGSLSSHGQPRSITDRPSPTTFVYISCFFWWSVGVCYSVSRGAPCSSFFHTASVSADADLPQPTALGSKCVACTDEGGGSTVAQRSSTCDSNSWIQAYLTPFLASSGVGGSVCGGDVASATGGCCKL